MKRVTAAIIKKEDKVLIAQRSKGDKLALKWEFPGGKIEKNETPEECLKREIKEELNLSIQVTDHFADSIYKYDSGEITLQAYLGEIKSGDLLLRVHNDLRWVRINELRNFEFCPADVPLVERMMDIYLP